MPSQYETISIAKLSQDMATIKKDIRAIREQIIVLTDYINLLKLTITIEKI